MGEDASLDDFLGEETADSEPGDGESAEETAAEPTNDEPAAERNDGTQPVATTTYAWDGAGAACGSCGEVVERRWQEADELVCVACKSW